MDEPVQLVRLVVASPGDVQKEREAVIRVVEELNRGIAIDRRLQLNVIRWETDAYPGFHPVPWRPGAGRKPNLAKRLLKGFTRDTIALAVEDLDVNTVIIGLLKSKSDRTRLETLAFLRDTLHGRPAQSVSFSGGLIQGLVGSLFTRSTPTIASAPL